MCPCGLVRSGDFKNGNPVPATDPKFDSNPVTWTPSPSHFGNPIPPADPTFNSNPVTWPVSPTHFGNTIGGSTPPPQTTLATPTFAISDGTLYTTQQVTLTVDAAATTTYYTTDGSTPDATKTLYSGPFNLTTGETINAISYAVGYNTSAIGTVTYAQQATPTFSPVAGSYVGTQGVTISSTGAGNIYYKIGGAPTVGDETSGSSVSVASTETLYARATRLGYVNSTIGSAAYVITTNVLRVPMSDGSGTTATDIIGGNNLTITPGSGSWGTIAGVANGVYQFDGSATSMIVANDTLINFERNQPFSLFFVMKGQGGSGSQNTLISTIDSGNSYRGWAVELQGALGQVNVFLVNTYPTNVIYVNSPLGSTQNNTLYSILVTYDGSSTAAGVKIYINGTLQINTVGLDTLTATMVSSLLPTVGERNDGSNHFNGDIGPLGIWNRVLTQAEVTTLAGNFYAVIN